MMTRLLSIGLFFVLAWSILSAQPARASTVFFGNTGISVTVPGYYVPYGRYAGAAGNLYYGLTRNGTLPVSTHVARYNKAVSTPVVMTPRQYAVYSERPPQKPIW